MLNKSKSIEAKKTGRPSVPNRQGLYARVAKFATLAIDKLAELLNSKNENISLGAAKVLLDKCLPDVKAIEFEPRQQEKFEIRFVEEPPYTQAERINKNNINKLNGAALLPQLPTQQLNP